VIQRIKKRGRGTLIFTDLHSSGRLGNLFPQFGAMFKQLSGSVPISEN
jgi:hypothetical protein